MNCRQYWLTLLLVYPGWLVALFLLAFAPRSSDITVLSSTLDTIWVQLSSRCIFYAKEIINQRHLSFRGHFFISDWFIHGICIFRKQYLRFNSLQRLGWKSLSQMFKVLLGPVRFQDFYLAPELPAGWLQLQMQVLKTLGIWMSPSPRCIWKI